MVASKKSRMELVRAMVASEGYRMLSSELAAMGHMEFCDDVYDAEIQYAAKVLDASDLGVEELDSLMKRDRSGYLKFCLGYARGSAELDKAEEHNPDELLEESSEDDNEEFIGFSQILPVECAVYFFLLKNDPGALPGLLKKLKKPAAERYLKWLAGVYAGL